MNYQSEIRLGLNNDYGYSKYISVNISDSASIYFDMSKIKNITKKFYINFNPDDLCFDYFVLLGL